MFPVGCKAYYAPQFLKSEAMTVTDEKNGLISDEMSQKIIDTAAVMLTEQGAADITVRKILQKMNITNRVFYNRFHNIDEVLEIVYGNTILKIRECLRKFDPQKDFFEQAADIVADTLIMSYENKMRFADYVFRSDSISEENFAWWKSEIKKLLVYAKDNGLIRDVDSDILSYSIWCFCRGYNADAVGRKLPKDEAVANFKYSFGIFLDGLRLGADRNS